ncbi:MAG: TonB-dependent receptor plug domain-containing protein, partial [Gammaproteobacteria bacterium]|nr:TonB-dependent receptor plug domain-containing protein [Gammaproteobacteria bacterium]
MNIRWVTAAIMALSAAAFVPAAFAQDEGDEAVFGESGIDDATYDEDVYGDGGADSGGEADYDAAAAEDTTATEYAYQGEERQLEEVVVTVERREQNLQDLGGTATTFNSEELKQYGVVNITDLQRLVPGLTVARNNSNIEVWIRGVGNSNNTELSDASTAFYLDGIYLPRNWGIGAGEFDMQRVEVLEGPQGTLRGRNAMGGSINFIPWRPGLGIFDIAAEASYANYDQTTFQAMVNVPLGNDAAFRFSGNFLEHDSYFEDVGPLGLGVAEANNNWALRGQVLWEPTENLRFYVTADLLNDEGTGYTGTNFANPLGNGIPLDAIEDPRKVIAAGFAPELDIRHWGTKFEVKYDFGWADLQYEFGYRD